MIIVEDCSPYYIRFTHPNIDKIINYCLKKIPRYIGNWGFTPHKLSVNESTELSELIPASKLMPLQARRYSLFITDPGKYYGAHKDGYPGTKFSINYPILIQDDKCITSWYSDEDILSAGYTVSRDTTPNSGPLPNASYGDSREVQNFVKSKHTPAKFMNAKLGEGILFNTDIFHDWDNSKSTNRRIVLTLRHTNPTQVSFDDAKKIMFNI